VKSKVIRRTPMLKGLGGFGLPGSLKGRKSSSEGRRVRKDTCVEEAEKIVRSL